MAFFVFAGKPDCPFFVHAIHVARYLEHHLPHFSIRIHQLKTGDWEPWLEELNYKHKWHHSYSPVIWKELSMRGGVAHYVGGLSEFWEYCYDYYGLESILSPEELQQMVEDNMQYFREMEKAQEEKSKNIRNISIVGVYNSMFATVLTELIQISDLQKLCGLKMRCYDLHVDLSESLEFVKDILEDVTPLATNGNLEIFSIVNTMEDVITDCELLIILGDYTRRPEETESDWLIRNMSAMFCVADSINGMAKRNLRVILAIDGPTCFNANTLIDTCTSIRIQNIVAVTSDIGLGPLKYVADQAKVALEELSAPPVWGYVGIEHFVDIESAIIASDIYRPYQRVIRNNGGSTLPLGIIQPELRFIAYLIEDTNGALRDASDGRSVVMKRLHRQPTFAKVRALVSLLKLWYAKDSSDDVISLGVCSNGSHGIPSGIVFSQPVILDKKVWVPFRNFPTTQKTKRHIEKLLPKILEVTENMNVGPYSLGSTMYDPLLT